jgi:RimJ/RimL family protein N-acetyltransferase
MKFARKSTSIQNALTGEPYLLQSVDSVDRTGEQFDRIAAICNEEQVYSWLFQSMFTGIPYPRTSAEEWLSWGTDGWKDGSHFVFAVLDSSGHVAAACDIKDTNLDCAEIGYWSSANHRGIMTNAVRAMIELASEAGFSGFFAEAHEDNLRSQDVLVRSGFSLADIPPRKANHRIYQSEQAAPSNH